MQDNGSRQVSTIAVGELKPYGANARTHTLTQIEQIAASLKEFGWTNPILVDAENGVIAGHARLEAAKSLGMEKVPCIVLDGLTPEQARAYVLADNKLALNAEWDETVLRGELEALKANDVDLELLGFDAAELDDIMLGPEIDQREYDESAADAVVMVTCPHCGKSFPR